MLSVGLSKTVTSGFFSVSDIHVINLKLCMTVPHIELYLFIALSVTSTLFPGHSRVKQFKLEKKILFLSD